MARSQRFLILGGTKFIGPQVARWLLEMGHHVGVFHRSTTVPDWLTGNVAQIQGDRRRMRESTAELRQFKPDVVIDMLAMSRNDAEALGDVFGGHAARVVVASSCDVYAPFAQVNGWEPLTEYAGPLTERGPLRTVRYPFRYMAKDETEMRYWYDKLDVEEVVMGCDRLPGTIIRLPAVYGPGDPQWRCTPYLRTLRDGGGIKLGRLASRHRLCRGFVLNMAWGMALAATEDDAEGRIFNVADIPTLSEHDWVRGIVKVAGAEGSSAGQITADGDDEASPAATGGVGGTPRFPAEAHIDLDCTQICQTLGYTPKYDFLEGLRRTVVWETANPAPPPPLPGQPIRDPATAK